MKTTKLFLSAAIFMAFATGVFAQEEIQEETQEATVETQEATKEESKKESKKEPDKGISLGIRGGVHLMSMGVLDLSVGWHAGAVRDVIKLVDLDILGDLYLQPGLLFFSKKSWLGGQTYWLEVPVMVSWKYKINIPFFRGTHRINIGPYFNAGLLGDFSGTTNGEVSDMNRFDMGLSWGYGSEYGMFWIGASVNSGFISISDYYNRTAWHYRLTLGLNF